MAHPRSRLEIFLGGLDTNRERGESISLTPRTTTTSWAEFETEQDKMNWKRCQRFGPPRTRRRFPDFFPGS